MSIVADKKNGKLTGRFRVQVMVAYQLIRKRVDTIGEANALNAHWENLKAQGIVPDPKAPFGVIAAPVVALEPARSVLEVVEAPAALPASALLSVARKQAEGRIWKGATERNCLGHLKTIEELMGDLNLNDITTPWVMNLQAKLREVRNCSDGTVNRYSSTVSRFLKWAIKMELRTVKDLPELEFRKESEGRIRWYEIEEEAEMLPLLAERSRKLVRFAILTGGRRGELMRLEPRDVFPDRIILWGDDTKSGRSRPIPLTKEGRELAEWLVVQGNMPTETMLRDDWHKMRTSNPEWEVDEEFVFHGCRHTFAVRAVDAGVPIRTLQKWMGHETIEMTERYAKVSGKALQSAKVLMFGEELVELDEAA